MSDYSWETCEFDPRFRAAHNYMQESAGIALCFLEKEEPGSYPCILEYQSSDWLLEFAAWLLDLAHRILAPAPGGAYSMVAPAQISSFEELAVAHWTPIGPQRVAVLDLTDPYGCLADSVNNGLVTLTYRLGQSDLRGLAEFYAETAFKAKGSQWWWQHA